MGRSSAISQHSVEVFGVGLDANEAAQNHTDAHVSDCIELVLEWAHFDASYLGDLTALHNYCAANSILISPLLKGDKAAIESIKDFAFIAYSGGFWSEGKLKFKPFSDTVASNSHATYTPDLTIVYEFAEGEYSDIRPLTDGKSKTDTYNVVQIEYADRAQDYNNSPVDAQDQSNIETYGKRKKDARTLECIHDAGTARLVAHNDLQFGLYLDCRGFEIDLPTTFDFIEPMDFVRLTCARFGLQAVRFRVFFAKDDNEKITLTIKEALEGVAHSGEHVGASNGFNPNYIGTPSAINRPILFVAPAALSSAGGEVWCGISCDDPIYGGCDVWLSYDNSTFKRIATHTQKSVTGKLTANFADSATTLSVDVGESNGTLDSYTTAAFDLNDSLVLTGNELLSYQNATLTGTNTYNLTTFHRALYDTTAGAVINDDFLLCDDSPLKLWFKEEMVGTTVHLKFQAFNYSGTGYQDLADLTAYAFTISASGRISVAIEQVIDP